MSSSDENESDSSDESDSSSSEDSEEEEDNELLGQVQADEKAVMIDKASAFIDRANNAAKTIQRMFYARQARDHMRDLSLQIYKEGIDEESNYPYWKNTRTGEIRWDIPPFYWRPERETVPKLKQLSTLEERLEKMRNERRKRPDPDDHMPLCLPSGEKYEGMTKYGDKNVPKGVGVMLYPNGGRYGGEWGAGGRRHGWGSMRFPDGSTYEGEFVDGKEAGLGVKIERNGSYYYGMWRLGCRHGLGCSFDIILQECYHGQFANDMPNGHGVLYSFEMDPQSGYKSREGEFKNGAFLNTTPRLCCDDVPDLKLETTRNEAKIEAHKKAAEARKMATSAAESRTKAIQARQRAGDERKRTRLTSDAKKLKLLRHAGDASGISTEVDPYIRFLETELEAAERKRNAAERRLRQVEHSASLAEQQWTESASSNAVLIRERDEANARAAKAISWKPVAVTRWDDMQEMRDAILQLRVALHTSRKQETLLSKRANNAERRARMLQQKLNAKMSNMASMRNLKQSQKSHRPMLSRSVSLHLPESRGYSRGALSSAGSSVAGMLPPLPSRGSSVGVRELIVASPPGSPLYYSPIRDEQGRAVSPLQPASRVPSPTRSFTPNMDQRPPTAADEVYVGTLLDHKFAEPPPRQRRRMKARYD